MKKLTLSLTLMITTYFSSAQKPKIGKIISNDPSLSTLIDVNSQLEILGEGFEWSDGPIWVKDGNYLLFSDVPKNIIYKWKEGEKITEFLNPSGYTGIMPYSNEPGSNGLTLTNDGKFLLACEHGDRRITKMPLAGKGGKFALADTWEGKRFNSPNDLVQAKSGHIYFTDPPYGLPDFVDDKSREIEYFGVYRISPDRKVTLEIKDLVRPNGVALSPDHKTLYVAQSDEKAYILGYPINSDGSVGKGKLLFDASYLNKEGLKGAPDGLKVDEKGNIFTTGPGGVIILSPQGKLLGRIETGAATANLAWGEDGSTLFITADMYLLKIKTKTKGANF
ncbi:SMP-30/gluconolactonase/LRE family protein [Lacihabitans soyangensis]|uniref:SMP-30/gluconolactonase/LRE family protein n=1 Tax=Lacihabitans soyangensis TaxID=869394 RepID=A0AAE3KSC1_9BACT|nr:SMP-30/gluconolactonase/LRE family protein [Lacihabitans soyangensis]MCP9763192.1 SMP-30/gluconolactonase/LRE family protein [Lacihabitans soyangensis]